MGSHRAIPELSIDTQTLERVLLSANISDVIPYAELSKAIGRNVQNSASHLLVSARRRVQREQSMVFEPVRGEGLKRLDDIGIAGSGEAVRGRIHNLARRGRQKLSCVADWDSLPNDVKVKHNVSLSVLGALVEVTKTSAVKRLEATISNGKHDALPVAKFLDAVRGELK